ncbi:MAG: PIN domain-containing protein [Acidimicrobiales bacterium]
MLDTNVISELMRPVPDRGVVAWVSRLSSAAVCTTAVILAEVRFGIAHLPSGRRRALLDVAADDVFATFADRVLPFDAVAAGQYADVVVERERAGAPISGFDAQIAAICIAHRAALATRNTSDFDGLGLDLIDPWITGV